MAQQRSQDEMIRVEISQVLKPLIPDFIKYTIKDVEGIELALKTEDFGLIKEIGHTLRGIGSSYGFDAVSELGQRIKAAAKGQDAEEIKAAADQIKEYLQRLQVVYV